VSDRDISPRAKRDDPESLLDARSDPAGAAFGTMGSEVGSELNWILMIRHRVQRRAVGSPRYQWWVLWSLLAGLLSLNFTFTVFNIVLGTVSKQFHTSITNLTWTTVGPLLAYGLAAPVFGKLGDIFGHRRLYILGLGGAAISAAATALAPNLILLVMARTLDGVAGAASGAASGALLNLVFRPDERVKAMGWWSLVGAGGPVIGVSLGSPIIAAFGWRALFWVQLVLIVIALGVVAAVLPHRRGNQSEEAQRKELARSNFKKMDWIGSWTLSLSVGAFMVGLTLASHVGWLGWQCSLAWLVTVIMIAAFVMRIRTADHPIIPPHYFRQRNFVLPMVVRSSAQYAYFSGFFLFPLLYQEGFGKSILSVGAVTIARPIVFSLCSPLAGYVAVRIGERVSVIAGAIFLSLSMLGFTLFSPSSSLIFVIITLGLSGLGMGVAMPSTSSIMANEVDPSEFGVMSAAQLLAMQIGQVAGIQVSLTVQQALVHQRGLDRVFEQFRNRSSGHGGAPSAALLGTFRIPFIIGGVMSAIAIAASLFLRSVPRDKSGRDGAEPVYDAH
jgi:MFS family permease